MSAQARGVRIAAPAPELECLRRESLKQLLVAEVEVVSLLNSLPDLRPQTTTTSTTSTTGTTIGIRDLLPIAP